MKKILFSILAIAISFAMYSCKDTTGPDDTATINLRSQLENSTVKLNTLLYKGNINSSDIDSIKIKKVRILITEVKFHAATETDDSKDNLFKSGPLLLVVDSTGTYIEMASGTIPSDDYSKLKFEIHRFEASVLSQYINSSLFNNFATSERYSVIINGISYKNGIGTRFEYKGTPNVNLTCTFPSNINIPGNQESNFYLMFDPNYCFKTDSEIYDPSDDSDHNKIDNLIAKAIGVLKKNN
ncbi:MAG: hypothetical protein WCR42_02060 [bacterium]